MSVPWAESITIAVPAAVSVGSAVWASLEARRARRSEREVERLRRLEERVSGHKFEVYQPMIEMLSRVMRGHAPVDGQARFDAFAAWHLIYGSDEAVRAYGHLMQATYNDAPPQILVRMYAEFFLAARRDLADDQTTLSQLAVMEPRINDLYSDQSYYEAIQSPLPDLFRRYAWTPPWESSPPATSS